MAYRISLSTPEFDSLSWITAHGYWPDEAFDGMQPVEQTEDGETVYEISEADAWSITELSENDSDAFLACCGEPLVSKLIDLWESIV